MDEASFETLQASVDGEVGALRLNRPDKLNALSGTALAELEEAAHWFDRHRDLKVVVVSGAGRAWSAGADIDGFSGQAGREDREQGGRMAAAIEAMRAVTVARIHGWCVGGGLVLAAACDLRIAATTARFSIPEVDLGIPLSWGAIPRLVRDLGPAVAKELVMTCRPFSADEAFRLGFLNKVVAEDQLDAEVDALVTTLASKAKYALLATKAHVNAVCETMVGTVRSWADADTLAVGFRDDEGRRKAAEYVAGLRSARG